MAIDGGELWNCCGTLAPTTPRANITSLISLSCAREGIGRARRRRRGERGAGRHDRAQLAQAERIAQDRLRRAAMLNGATLIAPETVFLNADTKLAATS